MKTLIKKRQSILELVISSKHRDHYLWLLTQSYSAIPKNLRRQVKTIFVWYPKERTDLRMVQDENTLLTDDELVIVIDFLRTPKHACLYVRNKHPRVFNVNQSTHLTLSSIPSFIVIITTLLEYRCSFISRPDLFCAGK